MIQRQDLPTQAEIDRGIARARQLRARMFAAAFARFGRSIRAGLARLFQQAAHGGARHA